MIHGQRWSNAHSPARTVRTTEPTDRTSPPADLYRRPGGPRSDCAGKIVAFLNAAPGQRLELEFWRGKSTRYGCCLAARSSHGPPSLRLAFISRAPANPIHCKDSTIPVGGRSAQAVQAASTKRHDPPKATGLRGKASSLHPSRASEFPARGCVARCLLCTAESRRPCTSHSQVLSEAAPVTRPRTDPLEPIVELARSTRCFGPWVSWPGSWTKTSSWVRHAADTVWYGPSARRTTGLVLAGCSTSTTR